MKNFVTFGNGELKSKPDVKEGDLVMCSACGEQHPLECGTSDGVKNNIIMFYRCGGKCYLGAVGGKAVSSSG